MSEGPNIPELAASDDWTDLVDGLLRGLGHALSNRVAGIAALVDIAADGESSAESDAEMRELMSGELDRLQSLNRLVKLLPRERMPLAEATVVSDVAADAVAVLALLPAARSTQWEVRVDAAAQPVRVERWVLLRALVLAAAGCLAGQEAMRGRGTLHVTGDEERTRIVANAAGDGGGAGLGAEWRPGTTLRELTERLGAEITRSANGITIALPTLQAVRRRERGA